MKLSYFTTKITNTKKLFGFGLLVLDLVTQVRDVVFVKCIFRFGKPQGVGILE
jgi:hypothetical protein